MKINFLTENQNTIQEVNEFITEWKSGSEFIIVKTSGSTGTPKEIQISKKHMTASALMTGKHLKLSNGNSALLCLSPSTIAGKMMIVRSLVIGMQLIVGDVKGRPLSGINDEIDFTAMVPMQLENSISQEQEKLSKVKKIIVGGGIVLEGLSQSILELPCEVHHTFGMTETISHIAMRNLSNGEKEYNALPNVTFTTENDCLIINAPNLGVNQLKTTDIVDLNSPTSFIWKGRRDFVINSGGVKIHPEEVETKLSKSINSPYFITGIEDAKLGSKVVLCIESDLNIDISKLLLSESLNTFQIPKEIYFFDAFVRTASDKINRIKTLELISDAKKQIL